MLHIHGAETNPTETLVLGHGWEPVSNPDPYRFERDPEDADVRVIEGQTIVDGYFSDTFKPTAKVIERNSVLFAGLSGVDWVVVMGHSVSEVDHPYFAKVIANIDVDRVRWKVSYYGDLFGLRQRLEALGVRSHQVDYALLSDF